MRFFDYKINTRVAFSSYIKQSIMVTLFLLVFLLVWNRFIPIANHIVFSAIASSAFLTFVSTSIYTSLSTKIIGGQIVGVLTGTVLWFALHLSYEALPQYHDELYMITLAVSVGLSLLFMSTLNLEHPPAAGTAMAFVVNPNQPIVSDAAFIISCAILLGLMHYWLKKRQLISDLE